MTYSDTLRFATPGPRERAEEARDRKDALRDAAWDMLNLLTRLQDLGIPRYALAYGMPCLLDCIKEADERCNKDIEAIKEWFEPIDLNEHRAMLAGLRVPL